MFVLPIAPTADEIFARAQRAWLARTVPAYVSFEIPCGRTFLENRCPPNAIVHFVVRTSDGRTYAAIPGATLMRGGFIVGPATTPFGFYRRIGSDNVPASLATPSPPNLAPDPLAPKTIASVSTSERAYDVELAGDERVGERDCYHLTLRPLYDPQHHPLRDLWVERESFEIVELSYARRASDAAVEGLVHYRFEPIGPNRIWTIVHIDADLPTNASGVANPASDLDDITFPSGVPDWYFDASLPAASSGTQPLRPNTRRQEDPATCRWR